MTVLVKIRWLPRIDRSAQEPNCGGVQMEIRSILFPTDFSECAQYALGFAASMARKFNAKILCLHVIEPMMPAVGYTGLAESLPIADISGQLEESASREFPKIDACEECKGLTIENIIGHGDAAAEIVRAAAQHRADLIVISSHGRTGIGRMLFGSTAESVVRHAICPVLVVKPVHVPEGN
jgi:nucleotide-binding universal stress UspA family protein